MKNTFRTDTKIWAELYNVSTGQTWAATYTDENNVEHTLIPADTVRYYFYYKYGDFYCEYMYAKWQMYNTLQAADLYRALQAWDADYNPLDNFDARETRVRLTNNGDTSTTRENDPDHNTVTTSALTGTESSHYTTTDDSDTARLETKDTTAGGTETTDDVKTTTETTRETTTLTVDGTSYTAHDVRGETVTRAGHDSKTSWQNEIREECEMRLNPVQKNYLDRFIYEYAGYVGGAW